MSNVATNEEDVELLRTNPAELVVRYRRTIEYIVRQTILGVRNNPDEFNDVFQEVTELLLRKLPTIQEQYNGSALLRTYVFAIVRNICVKVGMRTARTSKAGGTSIETLSEPPRLENQYLIEHECFRLRAIFLTFGRKRAKLLLCLKLDFRISITADDIDLWNPDCPPSGRAALLDLFGDDYEHMRDADVFDSLAPFWNDAKKKNTTADSIRKWTNDQLHEIIRLLNGDPPRCSYDRSTTRTLFEYFIAWDRQHKV